jgi:hypothetical protein
MFVAGHILVIAAVALPDEALDGATIASQFRQICMETGFDPAAAQRAMDALRWKTSRQPDLRNSFSRLSKWTTSFGTVAMGYRVIGGVDLKIDSCNYAVHQPVDPESVKQGFRLAVPFRSRAGRGKQMIAKLIDRDDEQSELVIVTEIAVQEAGKWKLKPGLLLGYSYARGQGAKKVGLL